MKHIQLLFIVLLASTLHSSAQNFNKLWSQVEAKELEGDIEKAIKLTERIYKKSLEVKDHPNIVKSFIYKTKFDLLVKENSELLLLERFETVLNETSFPSKAFLENLYAKFLISSYEENKYKIDRRSHHQSDEKDMWTWTKAFYIRKIDRHVKNSLEQAEALKSIDIETYKSIIEGEANSLNYRPTLYDLFANDAIAFYAKRWMHNALENYTTKLSEFGVNTNEFISLKLPRSEQPSNLHALKLYQDLESFHLKTKNYKALFDTYKNRIYFLNPLKVIERNEKSDALAHAMQSQIDTFKSVDDVSILYYHAANYMYETSNNYFNLNDTIPYRVLAYNTCKQAINNYPNSLGAAKCTALNHNLSSKYLRFEIEPIATANQPALALVEYSNTDTLYMDAYRIPYKSINTNSRQNDSIVYSYIANKRPIKSASYLLVNPEDFKTHTAEVLLPKLDRGNYIIVFSNTPKAKTKKDFAYYSTVRTNLFINHKKGPKYHEFQVTNRETGRPIKNAHINIFSHDGKYNIKKRTNTNGFAKELHNELSQSDLTTLVTFKNDTLIADGLYLYGHSYDTEEEWDIYSDVVLDRQIYRPGQTVNFKVYLYQNKYGKRSVLTNVYCSVILSDANGNDLKEYRLKVNDFGTASGSYKLPKDIVTGEFMIEVDEDYDYEEEDHPVWDHYDDFEYTEKEFYVEEYKRPRFEVVFNPITENYNIGDTVSLSGEAKSFFKTKISNAKVAYTVRRTNYGKDESNIKGETITDENGTFVIEFPTNYKDNHKNSDYDFYYSYAVEVDITDINGETQSKNRNLKVGNYDLDFSLNHNAQIGPQKDTKLTLIPQNLNEGFTPCEGEFSIYRTKNTNALSRRSWEMPEYQMVQVDSFMHYFPYLKYTDEDASLPKDETLVYTTNFKIAEKYDLSINTLDWASGRYIIEGEARVIGTEETQVIEARFNFKNTTKDQFSTNNLFTYTMDKFKAKNTINFKLNSAYNNVFVTVRAYHKNKEIYNKIVNIDEHPFISIPKKYITSGTINVVLSANKFGKLFNESFNRNIATTNNQFNIEVLSFRNRLTPNEKETWEFRIDHNDKDVEVLASMYDSSLDMFFDNEELDTYDYSKDWNFQFETYENFRVDKPKALKSYDFLKSSNFVYHNYRSVKSRYVKLNFFGLDFRNYKFSNERYIEKLKLQHDLKKLPKGNVSGIVMTAIDGLPLPGASVMVKGTNRGVSTDFDGFYSIDLNEGETLVFSYVGMLTTEIPYSNGTSIHVALEEDGALMDQVVVVGYSTMSKAAFTGTASVVYMDNIDDDFLSRIKRALRGQVAGVNFVTRSGAAGNITEVRIRGFGSRPDNKNALFIIDGMPVDANTYARLNPNDIAGITVLNDASAASLYGSRGANGVVIITSKYGSDLKDLEEGPTIVVRSEKSVETIDTRKDLKETAFFLPNIKTDANNHFEINFDSPEALTTWKLQLLAHTKNNEYGYLKLSATTSKALMVTPNFPRFLREGDRITLAAKVSSQSPDVASGYAYLKLYDADTDKALDMNEKKAFTLNNNETKVMAWSVSIPEHIDRIRYKIVASTDQFSDGEEGLLEVLKKKILVTETLPISVDANSSKAFNLESLASNTSETLQHEKLTIEYSSNPIWSAVQSLPYLINFPYDCAEQTFSKYYANVLGNYIIEGNEQLKIELLNLIEDHKGEDSTKLESLKLLLDTEARANQELQLISKLDELQQSSGAFSWFAQGDPNEFITRHIVASYGHLIKVGAIKSESNFIDGFIKSALNYLDKTYSTKIEQALAKNNFDNKSAIIHYLYARGFYKDVFELENAELNSIDRFIKQFENKWVTLRLYEKVLYANVCHAFGYKKTANKILKNLKGTAVKSDSGMYWKENNNGYYWNESQIETQALIIETFVNLTTDNNSIYNLKKWLLMQKQTNSWKTTKATTEAIYALLLGESKTFNTKKRGSISLKNNAGELTTYKINSNYKKIELDKTAFNKLSSKVDIKNTSEITSFGGIYWQYFEDLDNIKSTNSPLQLHKTLFLKSNSNSGDEFSEITADTKLKVGDLVKVRIELRSDRSMEFLHLKDMRAAGFEPINVLSRYKWKDGLGYYESIKDTATHFFIDALPKGVYVFEYELRVNNVGTMSNGICTLQSMYAPEFSSHTQGISITAE